MAYFIRLTEAREAREALLPIWAENLPVRGEPEAKLRWFYCDGPHGPGRAFVIHPERECAAAIGTAGFGVRALQFRDRTLRAALFADLAVDRAHRSGLPALALVRAVKRHVSESFDLGYGLPNARAAALYQRAGYRQLGEMQRYVRVLRAGAYLEQRLHAPRVAHAAAAIVDRVRAAASRARALRTGRDDELTWHASFDARFDRLWDAARGLAPIVCQRTAALLNWRFAAQPGHRYHIATLADRASGELRAYAVVREVGLVAELADLFGAPHDLDPLLFHLAPALYELGFGSISFRVLGAPWIPELLARHGFARRKETRMVALSLGERMARDRAVVDPAAWFMTDLDEDS